MVTIVQAPFSGDQVESINGYQRSGTFHEYTCHLEHDSAELLTASSGGLYCTKHGLVQEWVHEWTADGTWRKAKDALSF